MLSPIFYIIIFLFGLMVGSFLNCVIYRLERGESFLKGRSYCPHCKHKLGFWDLVPVLSFICLWGRCRYCRQKISIQYPLVEIATGLLFLAIFITFNWPFSIFYFLISIFLVIIFVYDLKHYIIPDKIIFPAIGIVLFYTFASWSCMKPGFIQQFCMRPGFTDLVTDLVTGLVSAFGAAAFFLTIVLLSRGKWMGVGDIKLAFLMGLILGWPNILVALFLAFLIGAIIGVGLIIFGKKTIKSEVPFGPFLVSGTLIAFFWGQAITGYYLDLFVL